MSELTEECLEELNRAVPLKNLLKESEKHPGEYNCINPECLSDHHVKIYTKSNRAHCAKCGFSFSAIDYIMQEYGMKFCDVCKALSERYGIELHYKDEMTEAEKKEYKSGIQKMTAKNSTSSTEKKTEDPQEAPETPQKDTEEESGENIKDKYKDFLEKAMKDVDKARDYLHGRGISDKTIKRFRIGYTESVYFAKAGKKLPAVVFPYNMDFSYYEARSLDGKYFYKVSEKEAGKEPVYNPAGLESETPCFVCESILDALSIIDAGGNACATNGTAYDNLLRKVKKDTPPAPLILFYDNDKPDKEGKLHGQDAEKALSGKLDALGIPYICASLSLTEYKPEDKDANDYLQSNRKQLEEDVKSNIATANDKTGIDAFLLSIGSEKYKPIPTGIRKIDEILHGGFIPQTLILCGGAPGTGKTVFCSTLFESIAKGGRKCLYVNYEMAKEQLLARSISRRAADIAENYRITALDVLQNYRNSEQTQKIIEEAAGWYKREIAPNMIYNPPGMTANIDKLMDYLNTTAQAAEEAGEPVPLICVDYLHLLSGDPGEDPAAILKRALFELKQFAIKYNTVVVGIQAQNREANKRKEASLEAGRDTSNLEYGADLVFQLVRKEPKEDPHGIHICITKSRFTETKENGIPYELEGDVSRLVYQGFSNH